MARVGPSKHVLDGAEIPNVKGAIVRGKEMSEHVQWHSDVRCAKTAEPVDLPFGLWTWAGRRKHKGTLAPPGKHT